MTCLQTPPRAIGRVANNLDDLTFGNQIRRRYLERHHLDAGYPASSSSRGHFNPDVVDHSKTLCLLCPKRSICMALSEIPLYPSFMFSNLQCRTEGVQLKVKDIDER